MSWTSLKTRLLENPLVYRVWQAPFAEQKLGPVWAHNDRGTIRRVLDVGCGPGTNTSHFTANGYLGIDINPQYTARAAAKFGREFVAADMRAYTVPPEQRFDFVFVNSFFHHIDDENTDKILSQLRHVVTPDGFIHILDLVMPDRAGPARMLAKLDRGEFPRPLERWREVFSRHFEPVVFEPYPLTMLGVTLWQMVYFKGKARP